jgi:hypothetical protein
MKHHIKTIQWVIVAVSLPLLGLPACAVEWGPLVEKLLERLIEHTTADVARHIVERATRGEPLPDLKVTDTQLRQAALDQVVKCIERAKWLDDHNPDISLAQGVPARIPFGYESELKAFHERCDSVLTRK